MRGDVARPLPAAEQRRLTGLYRKTRSPDLERKLVEANLRLVIKIARQLDRSGGRQLDDLVQEGAIGLMIAIRRFDPSKGASLSTYAAFWIRAFVMRHIMENVRLMRVVRTRAERAAFFRGSIATDEVSFDATVPRPSRSLKEIVPDPAPRIDDVIETAELAARVRQHAARLELQLPARDAVILRQRLLADEPGTQRQVGRRLSLSGERVRQIEGTLRAALQSSLDDVPRAAAA